MNYKIIMGKGGPCCVEWVEWGRRNLLNQYPEPILNDVSFFHKNHFSWIVTFEIYKNNVYMVIFMIPQTKQIYIFSYNKYEIQIKKILSQSDIRKVTFHKETFEQLFGSTPNLRDIQEKIEKKWEQSVKNFSTFLGPYFHQNFTFREQIENINFEPDKWTKREIDTGCLHGIGIYEFICYLYDMKVAKK